MSSVKVLFDVTKQMCNKLEGSSTKDKELLIDEINTFIDQRDKLIVSIKAPYSDEEKALGKQINEMDKKIQIKFESLLNELKNSMKNVQNQKSGNKKYLNPYGNISSSDGVFFDKRN
ncbi:flagellar protein FliT [Radiobacillus deserti]|uniref:Flagellar protein FliT n=1 Tax=Radiobacillus deserti TaxID=2594883 RepID=A0A516KIQ5_9BACI|nr:flagellar protein FliT [Radiobacillus deserti]QDP41269.1 flagellar protein FliT [Radiobacillus deserti]